MTPEEEKNNQEIVKIFSSSKKFCENARVLIGEGQIIISLYSAGTPEPENFVLTPHHAKRLSQLFSFQIQNYETNNGTIPTSWVPPAIQSPIQTNDLTPPPQDSEAGASGQTGKDKPDSPPKK